MNKYKIKNTDVHFEIDEDGRFVVWAYIVYDLPDDESSFDEWIGASGDTLQEAIAAFQNDYDELLNHIKGGE